MPWGLLGPYRIYRWLGRLGERDKRITLNLVLTGKNPARRRALPGSRACDGELVVRLQTPGSWWTTPHRIPGGNLWITYKFRQDDRRIGYESEAGGGITHLLSE